MRNLNFPRPTHMKHLKHRKLFPAMTSHCIHMPTPYNQVPGSSLCCQKLQEQTRPGRAEPPLSRSQSHKVFWGVGQTTLNPVRCLQVGHEDFNDCRDGDGERLLRALLDYEDSTFKPLQLYRSPEPGCEDVRDSDCAGFCMIACGCASCDYLNCGKHMLRRRRHGCSNV